MEHFLDSITNTIFHAAGIDKYELKAIFTSYDLGWLWNFFRDYLFNYNTWIFGAIPVVLLEIYKPVFRNNKLINENIIQDALIYPFFGAIINILITSFIIVGISEFYKTYAPFMNIGLLDNKPLWIQAIGVFLISDLMFYITHRLMHEVRWLWYFHAIHHSQTHLNPFTVNRLHPFEGIISKIVVTIPIGIVGGKPSNWIVFLIVNNFWVYFTHSNIKTNLGFLKYILVTPQSHRIHHSIERKHFDKNYGQRLVIWDWLFGSMCPSFTEYPKTGVPETEWIMEKNTGLLALSRAYIYQMIYPFIMIYRSINTYLRIFIRKGIN